jgi:hypothetical protein
VATVATQLFCNDFLWLQKWLQSGYKIATHPKTPKSRHKKTSVTGARSAVTEALTLESKNKHSIKT